MIENFDGLSYFNPWNQWLGKSLVYLREVRLVKHYYTSCTVFFVYSPLIYVHSSNIQKSAFSLSNFFLSSMLSARKFLHSSTKCSPWHSTHCFLIFEVDDDIKTFPSSADVEKDCPVLYCFFCLPYLPYSVEFCYYLKIWIKVTWSHVILASFLKNKFHEILERRVLSHSSFLCATIFPHLVTIQSGN